MTSRIMTRTARRWKPRPPTARDAALPRASEGQGDQLDRLDLRLDPRAAHRAKLDNNAELEKFAATLEKVCVETVETSFMTKDLTLLVGAKQRWLSTTGFLDKVAENLTNAITA